MSTAKSNSKAAAMMAIAFVANIGAAMLLPVMAQAAPSAVPLARFYPAQLPYTPDGRLEDPEVWLAKVQGLLVAAPALLQQSLLSAQTANDFAANVVLLQQMQEGLLKQRALDMKNAMKSGRVATKALGDASNLVYKSLEPCRIMDTRFAAAGSGVQGPLVGNTLYSLPGFLSLGSTYQQYGGEYNSGPPTDCGLTNPPGTSIKAIAIVITILNPNVDAFLGVSDVNSLSTVLSNVALNYTHGQGLSTVYVVPQLSSNTIYFALPAGVSTQLIFDVVGYYVVSDATALDCTQQSGVATTIAGSGGTGNATSTACLAGYTLAGGSCDSDSPNLNLASQEASGGNTIWFCSGVNSGASSAHLTATANCCRIPGK